MSDPDVDKEALQDELGQIKRAMGLHEEYPYWSRFWVVEGVAVGALLVPLQLGLRDGFDLVIGGVIVAILVCHQLALWYVLRDYERPTTGVPSWRAWHGVMFAGMVALIIGLRPVLASLEGDAETWMVLWLVAFGTLIGVAYLYLGLLLEAYNIRNADRYAFYAGGAWTLALVATIPYVSAFEGWEFAVFGAGYALYCVAAYVAITRT